MNHLALAYSVCLSIRSSMSNNDSVNGVNLGAGLSVFLTIVKGETFDLFGLIFHFKLKLNICNWITWNWNLHNTRKRTLTLAKPMRMWDFGLPVFFQSFSRAHKSYTYLCLCLLKQFFGCTMADSKARLCQMQTSICLHIRFNRLFFLVKEKGEDDLSMLVK